MYSLAYLCHYPVHYQFFQRVHERLADLPLDIVVPLSRRNRHDAAATSEHLRRIGVPHLVRSSGRYGALISCVIPTRRDRQRFGRWNCSYLRILYATTGKNYTFSEKNRIFDLILTIGPDSEKRLSPFARCVSVGLPRFDDLFAGRIRRDDVLEDLGLTTDRKVIVYAPTWTSMSSLDRFGAAVADLGHRYAVIIKPHQLTSWQEPERLRSFRDAPVRLLTGEYPFDRLLAASDLVISDYSSAIFEAAACDRPVVLLDSIDPERADPALYHPEDLEHTARDLGPRVDRPDQVAAAVEVALADPAGYRERRRRYTQGLFVGTDGSAADRSAEAIRSFLAEAPAWSVRARRVGRLPRFLLTRLRNCMWRPRPLTESTRIVNT